MSYMRRTCDVTSSESVYQRCSMRAYANGVMCDVVEWVKRILLKFDYMEWKKGEKFMKKVYVSEIEGPSRRGRPVVRWKDLVKEYMHEIGTGLEQARMECLDRDRWRLYYCGHPLGGRYVRERSIRDYR